MKKSRLRKYIISKVNPDNKKNKDFEGEKKYDDIIRSTPLNELEKLDRFYYRYVFSRNMLTAQIIFTLISMFVLWNTGSYLYPTIVIVIGIITVVLFYFIVSRDLQIHASFVFSHSDKVKK